MATRFNLLMLARKDTVRMRRILLLYDQLAAINYSPAAALNRIYALYKAAGPEPALAEMGKLDPVNDPFYHILLSELRSGTDRAGAKAHLEKALILSKTREEQQMIRDKIMKMSQV